MFLVSNGQPSPQVQTSTTNGTDSSSTPITENTVEKGQFTTDLLKILTAKMNLLLEIKKRYKRDENLCYERYYRNT